MFIPLVEFPAEFPYLIDYMHAALTLEITEYKSYKYKLHFAKLTWDHEQMIIESIRVMIMNLDNR